MKKLILIAAILITGFISSAKSETKIINNPAGFEYGFFYSNLSPYGTWMEINGGLVVWRPTIMHRGWTPYRDGQWIWTSDGWYWDSYEPFGYIVFHYGRWYFDNYYGWLWVPDYDWAPAWVDWRYDDDYIGWAPLPPYAIFSINIGIHYTYDYYVPYYNWHFVNYNHFCDPYAYNYYAAPKYKERIYNRTKTKYRNNYGYRDGRIINNGVDVNYVRERSGQNIRQRNIIEVNNYKEVEKYRGKDTETIRTFVASRDELKRNDVKDVKIEKETKRTSLDIEKVRLGKENNESSGRNYKVVKNEIPNERVFETNKNVNGDNENIVKKNNPEIIRENRIDVKKNDNIRIEKNIPKKMTERKEVTKIVLNRERNADITPKTEVRKESTNRNNNIIEQKRENKVQVQRENKPPVRTEVKRTEIQRNTDLNRNQATKKVERNNNTDNVKKRSR